MTIESQLTLLEQQMLRVDLGNLDYSEAALFHIACDCIRRLIDSREQKETLD